MSYSSANPAGVNLKCMLLPPTHAQNNMKKFLPVCALLLLLFGCKKDVATTPHVPFVYTDSIADHEGNYYHTVIIGSQVWMAENLRSSTYQNGDGIPHETSSNTWSNNLNDAYCYYDNDYAAASIYGNLYNYRAVNDARNICPAGWHIPTYGEWQQLISYLQDSASDKLREYGAKHWFPPNANATDAYGFAALPGGWRNSEGDFENVRHVANFWSVSHYIPSHPNYPEGWALQLFSDLDPTLGDPLIQLAHLDYKTGCAVRCVKD